MNSEYEVRYLHGYQYWPNTTILRRERDGAFLLFRKLRVGCKQRLVQPVEYSDYAVVKRAWEAADVQPREGDYVPRPVLN